PPADWQAVAVPGEDALAIGFQKLSGAEIAADAHQPHFIGDIRFREDRHDSPGIYFELLPPSTPRSFSFALRMITVLSLRSLESDLTIQPKSNLSLISLRICSTALSLAA